MVKSKKGFSLVMIKEGVLTMKFDIPQAILLQNIENTPTPCFDIFKNAVIVSLGSQIYVLSMNMQLQKTIEFEGAIQHFLIVQESVLLVFTQDSALSRSQFVYFNISTQNSIGVSSQRDNALCLELLKRMYSDSVASQNFNFSADLVAFLKLLTVQQLLPFCLQSFSSVKTPVVLQKLQLHFQQLALVQSVLKSAPSSHLQLLTEFPAFASETIDCQQLIGRVFFEQTTKQYSLAVALLTAGKVDFCYKIEPFDNQISSSVQLQILKSRFFVHLCNGMSNIGFEIAEFGLTGSYVLMPSHPKQLLPNLLLPTADGFFYNGQLLSSNFEVIQCVDQKLLNIQISGDYVTFQETEKVIIAPKEYLQQQNDYDHNFEVANQELLNIKLFNNAEIVEVDSILVKIRYDQGKERQNFIDLTLEYAGMSVYDSLEQPIISQFGISHYPEAIRHTERQRLWKQKVDDLF